MRTRNLQIASKSIEKQEIIVDEPTVKDIFKSRD